MSKELGLLILKVLCFSGCLLLVIYGQKEIGAKGLSIMLAGLAGLLLLLFQYNKNFT